MSERLLTLYEFNLAFCEGLSADITEAELYERAGIGLHLPGWILGHLAIFTDYAARCLGLAPECPESWHAAFGPGSSGAVDMAARPTKAQLLDALRRGQARVTKELRSGEGWGAERLGSAHRSEILAKTSLRTVGDALAHIMATHYSMHLGQLSVCRRAKGAPAILK
jgi:hypothetical protein